jgi:hypothetical protein
VPEGALLSRFGVKTGETGFVKGSGCAKCSNTGYKGRIGVYEMLRMTAAIQRAVDRTVPTASLRRIAQDDGMRPMWMDGLDKARIGMTTLEEVGWVVATELVDDTVTGAGGGGGAGGGTAGGTAGTGRRGDGGGPARGRGVTSRR